MRKLYRSRAVASAHVGDRMDMPVRIVRIRSWVALVIAAMGAMAIGAWLFLGTVSTTASGPAILTRGLFAVPIQSPEMVTIQDIRVRDGDPVTVGETLITAVTVDGRTLTIKAPIDGTAASVGGTEIGGVFGATDVLMAIERDEPIVVQALIPVSSAETVRAGMSVSIVPQSAPAGAFGVVPGVVTARTPLPVDTTFMERIVISTGGVLGASGEPAYLVTIEPQVADTPSGFKWTAGEGPPRPLEIGSAATVVITVASSTPIRVVLGADR